MARVALMTVGVLHAPADDPREKGFMDRLDGVWEAAGKNPSFIAADGFIGLGNEDPNAWGIYAVPSVFQQPELSQRTANTLTLWRDIESAFAFAYQGVHGEAFKLRREWFVKSEWPGYVAWWVEDDHTPTWQEGCERYDLYLQKGTCAEVFDFKQSFDAQGNPFKIDRQTILRNIAHT
jgi:hypothetical protein